MPAFELRTAPFPLTATDSRKDAGANAAATAIPGDAEHAPGAPCTRRSSGRASRRHPESR